MILLTGATGTSGQPILQALLDRSERVRALVRDPLKAAKELGDDVELVRGDFDDPASLDAAMEGVDRALLHSPPSNEIVRQQRNFIDAAKRNGIGHIVKFSVWGADANSKSLFDSLHGQGEAMLKSSGIAWTMLQPTFFMQNFPGVASMIKGGAIYMPTGNGKAAFIDVRDIAAVAAAALSEDGHAGKAYELGGPQSLSYADVAATFSKVLGRAVKHVDIPPDAAKKSMMDAGLPQWRAEAINQLSAHMKAGNYDRTNDNVKRIGGKDPITLDSFIRENVAAFT